MALKIYTKTGDSGQTSLFGGRRVPKYDLRIEAYGTVDELNAAIGMCLVSLTGDRGLSMMRNVQDRLFTVGSNLASDPEKDLLTPDLLDADIEMLESEIDLMNEELPELRNFVLPGGIESNARLHLARCICRRAERRVLALQEESLVDMIIVKYLNRLSDYIFVLSRYESFLAGAGEIYWIPRK
jgi:cob(I)alamin adenosyltransferase